MTGPVVVSAWYELVNGGELLQGDVLADCPVFRPPKEMPWPLDDKTAESVDFDCGLQDAIVLTQSCDMVEGQKGDLNFVLLCPVWSLEEAGKVNKFLASSFGKEECRRGHMTGYHMVAACDHPAWKRGISIVSFREVLSLPLDFVRKVALAAGPRIRLSSPYREHLAQAFARYFMRVGLPVDLPEFKSDKDEREVLKRLKAMGEVARKRIFDLFQ